MLLRAADGDGDVRLSVTVTARAASRLTPRIVAYQVKRLARNRAVPKIAESYDHAVRRTAERLPEPAHCAQLPVELASFIGAFYRHTDDAMMDARRGRFTILGRTVDFGSIDEIDWSHRLPDEKDHHLWRMKLAHLEVVHSLLASGLAPHHDTAVTLLDTFAASRNFLSSQAFVTGWAPYGASHRLLAVLSGLGLAARHGEVTPDVRARVQAFARLDAGFLWRNIEHDLRNNHTERNLAALCLYHLAAASVSPDRAARLDREVDRIIRSTVLPDGMQIERSAMYQGLTVMSLRIFAACSFLSASTRALARARADAATSAWLFLTHDDGEIALFNDAWLDEVPPPGSVVDERTVEVSPALPDAGYFRIAAGDVAAIFDAGEIGPRWNPGHGHADFLAIEADVSGHRLLVDPGTSQYSTGPQRTYERSAASHNGPRYLGVEPVEYSGCFKVGRLTGAVPLPQDALDALPTPAVGGRISTPAGDCTRVVCALPAGGLLVVDRWSAAECPGLTSVLIPAAWEVDCDAERGSVFARLPGVDTSLQVFAGELGRRAAATWSRRYLQAEQAHSIELVPAPAVDGGSQLVWGIGVTDPADAHRIRAEVDALLAS